MEESSWTRMRSKRKRETRTNSILGKATRLTGAGKRESTEGALVAYKKIQELQIDVATYVSQMNAMHVELLAVMRNEGIELQKKLASVKGTLFSSYSAQNLERSVQYGDYMQQRKSSAVKMEDEATLRRNDRAVNKQIGTLMEPVSPVASETLAAAKADHEALVTHGAVTNGTKALLSASLLETSDGIGAMNHETPKLDFVVEYRTQFCENILDLNLRTRPRPKHGEKISQLATKIKEEREKLEKTFSGCGEDR